jgi:pimeloyl-ACP methyl ester carboxylesterase
MTTSILYKTPSGERAVMSMYDAALKNWLVPYETQKIPTRHGETFVISSGDVLSPAMILLHGAAGNSTQWAGDITDFSRQFRVYAVDLPGEAGKSAPNRPAWDSPAFAEWLEDVFNGLDVKQAVLVGISQGAWTALKFAVALPHRVDKLVLIAPGGIIPDRLSFIVRAILLSLLGKEGNKRLVRALFGDQLVPTGVEDIVIEMMNQFKPRLGVLPIFSDEELRRLTMPTLLLGGTKDILRDMDKIATRLRGLVPNLVVNIIPGGGHALLMTSSRIMEFLMHQPIDSTEFRA